MADDAGIPQNLVAQVNEILDLLDADMRDDLIMTDDALQVMLDRIAFTCLTLPDEKDARWAIRRIGSALLWAFIVGREHGVRGHDGPAFKPVTNKEVLPDYLHTWFGQTPPSRHDRVNGR
jgi:hypothetical protein